MNNRGSTLIIVLIFMMVLSILSLSILYLTVSNNKMQQVDVSMKKEFYGAEAGLEEAYAKIERLIYDAYDSGQKVVSQKIADEVDKEDYTLTTYDLNGAIIGEEIDEDKLGMKMETWFRETYTAYLSQHIEDRLEAIDSYEANTMYPNRIVIEATTIDAFGVADEYVIQLESSYESDDGSSQRVSRSFAIGIPDYNQPYYREEKYYDLKSLGADTFIDNALTAEKNIQISGGKVTVFDGHVYALGGSSAVDSSDGITIEAGFLTLEGGHLITRKYIKTIGNNGRLAVNGDVYCNTLAVDSDASNASITIGKEGANSRDKHRVLTEDDIELNGRSSDIKIYGSYYGFSVGITNTLSDSHDQSSALIINSPDIGTNSSISITGEASDHDLDTDPVGVVIGGTAYIDFNELQRFQTGESVSIGGNYLAYTPMIVPLIIDQTQQALDIPIAINEETDYGIYSYTTSDGKIIETKMVDTYNGGTKLTARMKGELLSQAKTNQAFQVMVGWNPMTEKGVRLQNVKYATGAYISSGSVYNDRKGYLAYQEQMSKLQEEYQSVTRPIYVEKAYDMLDDPLKVYHETRQEFLYMNKDETQSIIIVGENGNVQSGTPNAYYVGDRIKGIIITAGDVYIYGKLYFEGIIATSGNIYFRDDEEKTIRLDKTVSIKSNYTRVGFEEGLNNPKDFTSLIKPFGWTRQ